MDSVASLLKALKKNDDWIVRRRALIDLSHEHDERLFNTFTAALSDPVSEVRHAAIIALSRLGDSKAVQELMKPKFLQSPDINIRWAALKALGQLGDINIIDALIPMVDDEEWLVRNEAISVLQSKVHEIVGRGDPLHGRILIRMLGIQEPGITDIAVRGLVQMERACRKLLLDAIHSVKISTRAKAAFVLGEATDSEAVEPLIVALNDPSPDVRAEAAKALGKIKDNRAIPNLIKSLKDLNDQARNAMIDALILFGDSVVDSLHMQLTHSKNKIEMSAILSALGQLAHPSSIPLLIEHLDSGFYLIRFEAVQALIRMGKAALPPLLAKIELKNPDITELLKAASENNNYMRRIRVIRALADLEDPRVLGLLKQLIGTSNRKVREAAQEALVRVGCAAWGRCGALMVIGRLGDKSVAHHVMASLEDDSPHVRYEALLAIGRIKDQKAIKNIKQMAFEDAVPEVKTAALQVLRELAPGSNDLKKSAANLVHDQDAAVRLEATRTLGEFSDSDLIPAMLKNLSDPYWSVRISAENALCNYGKNIVPNLIDQLPLVPFEGRCRIISALANIGDKRAIPVLEALTADDKEEPKIHSMSREALSLIKGETGRTAKQGRNPLF